MSKKLVRIALVAALYLVLTVAISPLSYGAVQLRFSEILMLLCFFRPEYGFALTVGCALSNLWSPFGLPDMIFGTLATALSALCMKRCKNIWVASLFPAIFNGIIVGAELSVISHTPFWYNGLTVALGELAVVTIAGVPIMKLLLKRKAFSEFLL